MAHWLMKSEPDVLSYEDVVAKKQPEEWHGVRNYAARNNMKAMRLGEQCFFYHSVQGKQIVGIVEVVALAHPDSTAEPNGKGNIVWECVDVLPVKKLPRPVSLEAIKAEPRLKDMALVKLSRLSVSPVTDEEWQIVCEMGGL
ncbi:MAG TPA: EVE domain-containing protein [Devosia sp.]|nr:EVE domain-containing protein [Devosia sp.]